MSGGLAWAIVEPSTNSTIECMTDCGWTTTSISSYGDAEQHVRLDHLQALVDQGGRVDRDDRAHVPGRVRQRLLGRDVGQLVAASARGTARRWRSAPAGDLGPACRRAGTGRAPSARSRPARSAPAAAAPDQRPAGDQRLLVGQGERRPGSQRGQRGRQPERADDAVEHHVARPRGRARSSRPARPRSSGSGSRRWRTRAAAPRRRTPAADPARRSPGPPRPPRRPARAPARRAARRCRRRRRARPPGTGPGCAGRCRWPGCRWTR